MIDELKNRGVTYWHFGKFPVFGPGIEQLCFEVEILSHQYNSIPGPNIGNFPKCS